MKQLTPFKAIFMGIGLATGIIMGVAAANLTTFVGKFFGDGTGLSNITKTTSLLPTLPTPASMLMHADGTLDIFESTHLSISDTGLVSDVPYFLTSPVHQSTNAFPLSPGTVWSWTKYHQFISTNADFNVTAIGGLLSSVLNEAELRMSNNGASQIICHLQFAMNKIGPLTTNDIYIASHKQAYANGSADGIGTATNIVTLVEP